MMKHKCVVIMALGSALFSCKQNGRSDVEWEWEESTDSTQVHAGPSCSHKNEMAVRYWLYRSNACPELDYAIEYSLACPNLDGYFVRVVRRGIAERCDFKQIKFVNFALRDMGENLLADSLALLVRKR